ncbi:MAG: hypothetical protein E6K80_04495 [Candidatus Eisenbacteria bacterium]|uniref:Uncharacterized protein n=1 Tax=Eiseniibacteriota bacterium TaxID=2212470 RepID=A0A538U7C2_UNCEI|nr:MAG: hypothetical protein E6K80_04495 [Candidatus Eisenbacteria bacterium]
MPAYATAEFAASTASAWMNVEGSPESRRDQLEPPSVPASTEPGDAGDPRMASTTGFVRPPPAGCHVESSSEVTNTPAPSLPT